MPGADHSPRCRTGRAQAGLAAALALLATALPAAGDLYRCPGPSGSVRFSDDPAACPGTMPHAPRRAVQRFESALPLPARDRDEGPHAEPAEAALEAGWRQKQQQARLELEALEREAAPLRRSIAWCNQGGKLLGEDAAGLPREISCDGARERDRFVAARIAELRAYLDEGIHEECRRAGCLPGWLR